MGFFDDIISNPVKAIGTGVGAVAGLPAGIFGMVGGGLLGNKLGGMISPGAPQGSGDYSGMSPYPGYVGMEPDQTAVGMNPAMAKYAQEAMRNGPTQGTQLALQANQQGTNMARAQAMKGAQGLAEDATSNLAMKGGIGAGARERIGKYASNIGMEGSNAADAAGGQARAGLLTADDNARIQNLDNAGKEGLGLDVGNMANKQAEFTRRNAYNMGMYNTQMAAWGAGKQADATANSGKK